ncbi:nitrilase-related carbon-nitrogen hydrolase [Psychromicrobium xiongbiense]|uniref:nitrilase-related carbon-nitrogen hydrolase n=1 Tax=Psychromicrobium xiongbiense TaxID=3051184 RepID=UPI003B225B05
MSTCFAPISPRTSSPSGENDPERVLINGGSIIVSPLGEVLAGPLRETEGVLLVDIETDDLAAATFAFDPAVHYTRPDIFTLQVDARGNTVLRD